MFFGRSLHINGRKDEVRWDGTARRERSSRCFPRWRVIQARSTRTLFGGRSKSNYDWWGRDFERWELKLQSVRDQEVHLVLIIIGSHNFQIILRRYWLNVSSISQNWRYDGDVTWDGSRVVFPAVLISEVAVNG